MATPDLCRVERFRPSNATSSTRPRSGVVQATSRTGPKRLIVCLRTNRSSSAELLVGEAEIGLCRPAPVRRPPRPGSRRRRYSRSRTTSACRCRAGRTSAPRRPMCGSRFHLNHRPFGRPGTYGAVECASASRPRPPRRRGRRRPRPGVGAGGGQRLPIGEAARSADRSMRGLPSRAFARTPRAVSTPLGERQGRANPRCRRPSGHRRGCAAGYSAIELRRDASCG